MDNEEQAVLPFDLFAEAIERSVDILDLLYELKEKDEANARRWAIAVTDAEKLQAWIRYVVSDRLRSNGS